MPWQCKSCSADIQEDDVRTCPSCGADKLAWTAVADKTRTFKVTKGRKVSYLLGATADPVPAEGYGESELIQADHAVAVPKAQAKAWHEQGTLPPANQVLFARLFPKGYADQTVKLVTHYDTQEVGEASFPGTLAEVELVDEQYHDVRFLFVYGEEELPETVAFEGLNIVEITEESESGFAPMVGVSALAKRRRDLPIESLKKSVLRLSCKKLRFNTDSAIVLPWALTVLQSALEQIRERPELEVLIASHTDTQGSDASNIDLSEARSKNVLDVLLGRMSAWAEDNERKNSHRNQDIREILAWATVAWGFECDPGSTKNEPLDKKAKDAVKQLKIDFAETFTRNHVGKEQTEEVDAGFWKRVMNLYGRVLMERLGMSSRQEIAALAKRIVWLDPGNRSIGCGEKYPRVATGDNVAEQENRRTEFLFFEPNSGPGKSGQAELDDGTGAGSEPAGEDEAKDPAYLEQVYSSGEYEFTDLPCPEPKFFGQPIPAGNVVFVIDISGSMSPTDRNGDVTKADRIGRAKRALLTAIDALGEGSRFTVVAYNSIVQMSYRRGEDEDAKPKLLEATQERKDQVMTWVNRLRAQNRTATAAALQAALSAVNFDPAQPKVIKFLSDGIPTPRPGSNQSQEQAKILREVKAKSAGWTLDVVGFFDTPSPTGALVGFLEKLAAQNGGQYNTVYCPLPAGAR